MKKILFGLTAFLLLSMSLSAQELRFGGDTTAGGNWTTMNLYSRCVIADTFTHAAAAGDTVRQVKVYAASASGATDSIKVSIYTLTNASPNLPATRVAAQFWIQVTSATPQWWASSTVAIPLDSVGTLYTVGMGAESDNIHIFYNTGAAETRNFHSDGTLPATWSPYNTGTAAYNVYAIYTAAAQCASSHSVTWIDSASTTLTFEDNYTNDSTVTSLILIWDDDTNPSSPLGADTVDTGITDPDTLVATGLSANTTYYAWFILQNGTCDPDTSSMATAKTKLTPAKRTLIRK